MGYVTAVRGHDAEWLLQQERILNEAIIRSAQRGSKPKSGKPRLSTLLLSIYPLEPFEIAAARRVVEWAARRRGAEAVSEILQMLGLEAS